MNFQRILVPVLGVVLLAAAGRAYGWGGVAIVATGFVTWILLHFNRITQIFRKAADRPVGYVGSAVMLNAKLKPRVNLLHLIATAGSLGECLSLKDEQPEIYRWTDGTQSHVTCEFENGKLVKWTLYRPPAEEDGHPPIPTP
jgi:hypothetical protein